MKKYLVTSCFFIISMLACVPMDIDADTVGRIYVAVKNYTKKSYEGYTFYIGAIKNDTFIATDSIVIEQKIASIHNAQPTDLITSEEGDYVWMYSTTSGSEKARNWKPNFEIIEMMSNYYAFSVKLSDGRTFLKQKEKLSKNKILGGRWETIVIRKDTLYLED